MRRQVQYIVPLDHLPVEELDGATASVQDEPLQYYLDREERQFKMQSAHEQVTALLRTVTPQQRSLLKALERHDMNQDAAVSDLGITAVNARVLMSRIRKIAKKTLQYQSSDTPM